MPVILIPNKCPLAAFEVKKSDLAKASWGKAENWQALVQPFCFPAAQINSKCNPKGLYNLNISVFPCHMNWHTASASNLPPNHLEMSSEWKGAPLAGQCADF